VHALGYLAADRPDIRRLLSWAEKQGVPIDEAKEKRGTAEARANIEDVEYISYIRFEAVKGIMSDALLTRAKICGALAEAPCGMARQHPASNRCEGSLRRLAGTMILPVAP
jgi:hypothetical protein